jgi:hypothetical protein
MFSRINKTIGRSLGWGLLLVVAGREEREKNKKIIKKGA